MFTKSFMIDIGRKYYSPNTLKSLIDLISSLGFDSLVLHFSENMGLGIECPAYGFLAGRDGTLCSQREVGSVHPDESVLSLPELSDIISYSCRHGISVIPSFDSPGHLNYTVKRIEDIIDKNGYFEFSFENNLYSISKTDGAYKFYKNGIDLDLPENTAGRYGIASCYLYMGKTSRVKGTNNNNYSRGIDLSNEVAVALVHSILESYAKLFYSLGCREIDIGGDEFLGYAPAVEETGIVPRWKQLEHLDAKAKELTKLDSAVAYDLFVLYMNDLYERMKKIGYSNVRLWNDEFRRYCDTGWNFYEKEHIQFNKNFIVQYWSANADYESPEALIANGYRIVNADSKFCYYVLIDDARCMPPKKYTLVNSKSIKDKWSPFTFGSAKEGGARLPGFSLNKENADKGLIGSMFCIWSDCPVCRSEKEVLEDIEPIITAWSEKFDSETNR